jgi:hypothetical protein
VNQKIELEEPPNRLRLFSHNEVVIKDFENSEIQNTISEATPKKQQAHQLIGNYDTTPD